LLGQERWSKIQKSLYVVDTEKGAGPIIFQSNIKTGLLFGGKYNTNTDFMDKLYKLRDKLFNFYGYYSKS